jgi:hypothetical protein
MERLTFADIVNDKKISEAERRKELAKLDNYDARVNARSFAGNKYLYHYQMENLCKTRVRPDSLYDIMQDDAKYEKLYNKAVKLDRSGTLANRLFEAERFNGAVVLFKPTTAKFVYQKYNAKNVLDPTAGWGGRMLGAYALDIAYTGIDTNINLKPAYDNMIEEMGKDNLNMIWESCMDVDFSEIDYDFVLTSPPYINLEKYENMTPFETDKVFYTKFLIPLIDKCLKHIRNNGWVCFNISPKMYGELIRYGFRKADEECDLLQQKRMGKDKEDKIYCWRNDYTPTRAPAPAPAPTRAPAPAPAPVDEQIEVIKKLLAMPCSDDDKAKIIRDVVLAMK